MDTMTVFVKLNPGQKLIPSVDTMCVFDMYRCDCNSFANDICYDGFETNPGPKSSVPFNLEGATTMYSLMDFGIKLTHMVYYIVFIQMVLWNPVQEEDL